MTQTRRVPEIPPIGRPESYYAKQVHAADKAGDIHAHEANKVGQYVTLALDPRLSWKQKARYFDHALRRHCNAPPIPDDAVWLFYRQLSDLVCTYAGEEALKLACRQDEIYAAKLAGRLTHEQIASEARQFFAELTTLGHSRPPYFKDVDWRQLIMLRDTWCG